MIRVERTRKPTILATNAALWTAAVVNAKSRAAEEKASLKYRHKTIRKALVEMFHGKCAYCESKILHIDFGHIEHFRPKSTFKTRTFTWKNLLLACGVCNGPGNKGTKFPSPAQGGPPLNPCDDIPDDHLGFVYDEKASIATVVPRTNRGETSVELYGLNRYELRSYRSDFVRKLYLLSKFAHTNLEARALLDAAIADDAEYAAFARHLKIKA